MMYLMTMAERFAASNDVADVITAWTLCVANIEQEQSRMAQNIQEYI